MGTPDFAVPALESLIAAEHEVLCVYTQAPKPAGRGYKLHKSAVQHCAEKYNIMVHSPVNFKQESDRQDLRDLNADMFIVAAYGLILPQAVLDIPPLGCLNIHGSLLPRWRGAAPIHRALLAGDAQTGITIMRMEAGLDTGPMLLKGETPIFSTDTVQIIHDRLSHMGADLVVKALGNLKAYPDIAQPEEGVIYAHKITKNEGVLQATETAQIIDRMARSLNPWPGVWLHKNEARFKLLESSVTEQKTDAPFGTLLNKDGDMACANGTVIRILKLQAPNGKTMDVASAINGGLLCVGK